MTSTIELSSSAPKNHSPLFDFLRATAAVLVLFGHTRNWIFTNIASVADPNPLLKFFWLITVMHHEAVVVFFVLSGFLVGGNILKSMERGSFNLLDYLIARFSRIYIVYAPALIVTALVFWVGNRSLTDFGGDTIRPLFAEFHPDFDGLNNAICHVAGVQGFMCKTWLQNPPLWSLGYEWALYLFAPAILKLAVMRGVLAVRLAGIALLLCGASAMSHDANEWIFWFAAWFAGVAAWWVSRKFRVPLAAGLIGLAIAFGCMAIARLKVVDEIAADTAIALFLALAISCRPLATLPLAPRFFSWAAGFSYSLYASHLPIIFLTIAVLQNVGFPAHKIPASPLAFLAFGICVTVALVFAYLLSLVTERQTEHLRTWMKSALGTGSAEASSHGNSIRLAKRPSQQS